VQSIVKSKSMVTEELELNGYLEKAGITVVETDLGEWVVQLAHDHPSHIVAPIIHLKREDVAKLFKQEAGATDEDVSDVPQMTMFARRMLRRAFLQADMGISGVNFAVADTGSVCICTNEGNGRLTTTLPRIHVAMMGIERIVPTMEDLGVMLQVLARSATGQKLTVYTNVLSGPRRPGAGGESGSEPAGEPDGPEELHVVMLDNGRSKLLGGELAEILYCIRCGACLNICPVYQEIGGHAYGTVYPGPVGAVLTPGLRGIAHFHELPNASSLCGACREVCPVRIDIPRMLLKLREEATHDPATAALATPWWLRMGLRGYQWMATRPALFRFAGRAGGMMTRFLARDGWISRLPGPLGGWTQSRDFPAIPAKSFTQRWQERQRERSGRS
jgi:L-lactate dehydrogenase complex protein LldF